MGEATTGVWQLHLLRVVHQPLLHQPLLHQVIVLQWLLTQPGTKTDIVMMNSTHLNVTMMVEIVVLKGLMHGITTARNVNVKEKTVLNHLEEVGEMAGNAKTSGTMLDAFMMGEIVVRILRAISAKMILPKLRPMLELIIFYLTSHLLYH